MKIFTCKYLYKIRFRVVAINYEFSNNEEMFNTLQVMEMEHELRALRTQIREKFLFSLKLQKEVCEVYWQGHFLKHKMTEILNFIFKTNTNIFGN